MFSFFSKSRPVYVSSVFSFGLHPRQNNKTSKVIKACIPMHSYGHPCKIEDIKKICDVKSTSFVPKPKVDSSLLLFSPRNDFYKINNPKNCRK